MPAYDSLGMVPCNSSSCAIAVRVIFAIDCRSCLSASAPLSRTAGSAFDSCPGTFFRHAPGKFILLKICYLSIGMEHSAQSGIRSGFFSHSS